MSALRSKALLAASLSLGCALAANAGGYTTPVVETVVAPVIDAAPADWRGVYVGGTLGYAFGGDDEVGYTFVPDDDLFSSPDKLELSGANGGLRVGYRTQIAGPTRDWVIGAELGYEGGNIEDSFDTDGFTADSSINNVLALRIKAGALNQAKDTLFYGIVGAARADIDYSISGEYDVYGGAADPEYFEVSTEGETMNGYIIGLGVERRLNERLSVTGEWEYANFGKETLEGLSGYSTEMTPDFHNIKIGLNYQF